MSIDTHKRYVVRIRTRDRKGIISMVTQVLYKRDLNIIKNAEYVDPELHHFFMRTEVEGKVDPGLLEGELRQNLPAQAEVACHPTALKGLVILVTKESHCLGDLLIRHAFNDLGATIKAVVGNHQDLETLVKRFDLPFHYVSHEGISREEHEKLMHAAIDLYTPDYVVLAKYMRILTPHFINHYPQRIVNIHHSFLPAFIGANPYMQAHARGVKLVGATAHIVNDALDEGPIITQGVVPVTHEYTAQDMARAGRDIEKVILAKAVRLVVEDRVFLYDNKTIIFE
jgi:formyltetrahydrofolate deformylase